jgi:hypothetical protein
VSDAGVGNTADGLLDSTAGAGAASSSIAAMRGGGASHSDPPDARSTSAEIGDRGRGKGGGRDRGRDVCIGMLAGKPRSLAATALADVSAKP